MAIWNKSDDPWDRKPERRKPTVHETLREAAPKKSPLEALEAWNAKRKSDAKAKDASKLLPPEPCPWCGAPMTQGYMITGRDSIHWYPGIYKTAWFVKDKTGAYRVDTDGDFIMHKITWHCEKCQKMVFDASNLTSLEDPYIAPAEESEETEAPDVPQKE